jgi:DNA-binding transcriptional LysR family regulator
MDVKKLRYFLVVAEEGQITRAARRLNMAQPPLSQQLKLLESELGMQLIQRFSRKIELTDAGRILRDRAEQILQLIGKTEKELKDLNEGLQGTLSIGATPSWGATFLPERIRSFHECYPGINFQLREGDTHQIMELINSGVVEIGIARLPADSKTYESISLPNEPLVAAMRRSRQDTGSTSIRLIDLAEKPLLLHRQHEALPEYYRQMGLEPRVLCRYDDVRSMLVWANAGLGIAIVPKSAANLIPGDNLEFREIVEPGFKTGAPAVIWMRNRYLSTAARHFIDMFAKSHLL